VQRKLNEDRMALLEINDDLYLSFYKHTAKLFDTERFSSIALLSSDDSHRVPKKGRWKQWDVCT
jgi:hypothetical protein